jgi:hypothetical protein
MALTATIYNFDIDLSDSDRGVYETVALRVAQHPSESDEYLIARVLAYLLEYTEGIVFSRGVSEPEEPMISVRDLTGKVSSWIDIGTPDSARLHKALSQGALTVAQGSRRRGHPPRRGARALRDRTERDRRARGSSRSTDGLRRVDQRSGAVRVDRRRKLDGTRRANRFLRLREDREGSRVDAYRERRPARFHHAIVNVQPIGAGDLDCLHAP